MHRNLLLPLGLQLKTNSNIDSQETKSSEIEQQDGVFELASGKSPKDYDLLDSGTSDAIEPDIVDPLNAFTEFWKLVEDNVVDGDKEPELELSEKDKETSKTSKSVDLPIDKDVIVRTSPAQTDQNFDSLSKSPTNQVPRRSTRKTKGQKPNRLGFSLNLFTVKWI